MRRKYLSNFWPGDSFEFMRGEIKHTCEILADDFSGYPWDEEDGHGIIECRTSSEKRPGELLIHKSRSSCLFYDFEESVKIAKRDGWGCEFITDDMTPKQKASVSAMADYEYCLAFAEQDWQWVMLKVFQSDSCPHCGCSEFMGPVASFETKESILEMAHELAAEIEG